MMIMMLFIFVHVVIVLLTLLVLAHFSKVVLKFVIISHWITYNDKKDNYKVKKISCQLIKQINLKRFTQQFGKKIMNDHSTIEIQKHNNKINRILNKICQKNPGLSEQIDLALYSCLKIDKIIKKHLEINSIKTIQNEDNMINADNKMNGLQSDDDQLYQNALKAIEGFKMATKKLENKVGVLLKEQQINRKVQRTKYYNQMEPYYEAPRYGTGSNSNTVKGKKKYVHTYEDTSPFNPQVIDSSKSKTKKNNSNENENKNKSSQSKQRRNPKHRNKSQSFQELQKDQSKNISQIDLQIVNLVSQIKHIVKGQ